MATDRRVSPAARSRATPADPRRDVHRAGHDPARQHHRERRPARHPARARRDAGQPRVDRQCLCPGPGLADHPGRHPRRPLWPKAALPDRPRRLHDLLRRLRPRQPRRGADRLPRAPGRRRGADGAPHALHPGRRLSPRGAHHRHRDLGERGGARLRHGAHRGRPAHRAIRLARRLLGQRAHRHRRLRARAGGRAGIAGSGRARARPRRQRARLRRPLPLDVRIDRDQRASLALPLYALAGRPRRRDPRRLPRPRGAHRASDGAARPVQGPDLQLRQCALHARLRLARRRCSSSSRSTFRT